MSGEPKEEIEKKETLSQSTFKLGDKVKIVSTKPLDIMRNDLLVDWEPPMDSYLGQKPK